MAMFFLLHVHFTRAAPHPILTNQRHTPPWTHAARAPDMKPTFSLLAQVRLPRRHTPLIKFLGPRSKLGQGAWAVVWRAEGLGLRGRAEVFVFWSKKPTEMRRRPKAGGQGRTRSQETECAGLQRVRGSMIPSAATQGGTACPPPPPLFPPLAATGVFVRLTFCVLPPPNSASTENDPERTPAKLLQACAAEEQYRPRQISRRLFHAANQVLEVTTVTAGDGPNRRTFLPKIRCRRPACGYAR
ncbi:MAG: hypothetical protein BJ554DRAFT_3267 [Olpidium bornovanus]|uniref:Uncharacterized protein n=1 Tax=Olpidium bornovanus TaxID=278681 RepID=A0A8H8DLE8_9FUNG|nr:MAG: hypothetical protein BJ554DRAFT_3267 [Olpidium bornovanus]